MKCVLRNRCEASYLCCNFCQSKKCRERCQDKHENCKYFSSDLCDIYDEETTNSPPEFMIKRSGKFKREQLAIQIAAEQAAKTATNKEKRGGKNAN